MMRTLYFMVLGHCVLLSCNKTSSTSAAPKPRAGGDTTLFDRTHGAFEMPPPNLLADELTLHNNGDKAFESVFVAAPATVNPGLGKQFNNNSCAGCHIHNGRGMPVMGKGAQMSAMLVRVSLPGEVADATLGANPVPDFGLQLQDHAITGVQPEVSHDLQWQILAGAYPDGETYELRKPVLIITAANGKALPTEMLVSLRQAPPVFGLGLLEVVPEDIILALADESDADGDGISGRPNYVHDPISGQTVIGRFGWKANTANLTVQTAAAYVNDMGLTSSLFNEDETPEISDELLAATTAYTQTLAVPGRTLLDDADVIAGEKLFKRVNCHGCHAETLTTGDSSNFPSLSRQSIHAYTDMLLHDMGEDLADNRPDFAATGREWRTSPLWGIGLTHTVLPYSGFLHDGRARTLEEAILWHGGEAEQSRDKFKNLKVEQRKQLLRFLISL